MVRGLCKARGSRKRIGAYSSRHVEVLSLERMCPESDWLLLSVVAFWDSHPDLLIGDLLHPSPGTMLYDELLVPFEDGDWLSIGGLHDSAADCILLIVLWLIGRAGCGFEESLLTLGSYLCISHFYFVSDFKGDLNKLSNVF